MWISCLSAKQPLLPSIESDSNNGKQLNLKKQYWCICQSHCRSTDNTHMWATEPAHQHDLNKWMQLDILERGGAS